jgi:hypothetical protein
MSKISLEIRAALLRLWLHKSVRALLSINGRNKNCLKFLSSRQIYGKRGMEAILKLLQRPWWYRLWIKHQASKKSYSATIEQS